MDNSFGHFYTGFFRSKRISPNTTGNNYPGYCRYPCVYNQALALVALNWCITGRVISIGVFTTAGTGYRLNHPADTGPFLGTLVQLCGLIIAIAAGIAGIFKNYRTIKPVNEK
jgi:hypothetical protein